MPIATVGGARINFEEYGSGEPVILLTGTGGRGREWTSYQVPALLAAGYCAITMDNRGVPPSDAGPEGFTVEDMAKDTIGLAEAISNEPVRIVGFSLGGIIALEALLARPEMFTQAMVMGARGRTDTMRAALSAAWSEILTSDLKVPAKYIAVTRAAQYLSPRTLANETLIRDWLDILELSLPDPAVTRAQRGVDLIGNRLGEYGRITSDCLIVSFADDLIVPPFFGREIADSIPGSRYTEVPGCGHYGHLERPEFINEMMIEFFAQA